ncbi:UDP-3-O-acylglucosamine N-acyltransferase (fragment) [Beijerinckiaceae bacterium RH AL1]
MSDPVFRRPANVLSLAAAAAAAGCALPAGCDPERLIVGVATLALAARDQLALAADESVLPELAATRAAGCLVPPALAAHVPAWTIALVSEAPVEAFARLAARFDPETRRPSVWLDAEMIDRRALVAADAKLEPGVRVAPGAVIGPGAEIGAATSIGANAVIEAGVRVGRGCAIGAHVTIGHALVGDRVVIHPGARIGVIEPGGPPCLGRAIIQDAVEIGANAAIARGGAADTILGEGAVVAACAYLACDTVVARFGRVDAAAGGGASRRG